MSPEGRVKRCAFFCIFSFRLLSQLHVQIHRKMNTLLRKYTVPTQFFSLKTTRQYLTKQRHEKLREWMESTQHGFTENTAVEKNK